MRSRHGLSLILVVGVLGVLAVLGTGFVTMARLERKASQQRLNGTKALLLARSGLEDALARLAAGQDPEAVSNRYAGEDANANGLLDAAEATAEIFGPSTLDRDACPVTQAQRPSFWMRARVGGTPAGNPVLFPVEGRLRGCSGTLSGDPVSAGDAYAVKISSGGIYVNGGDPSVPANVGYNAVLRRILGTLAEAIDRDVSGGVIQANDGSPVDQADGEALVDLRPRRPEGWTSLEEIREVALGGSQSKLDALGPYLALMAWVDQRVIAPNVDPTLVSREYSSWGAYKLDRPLNPYLPDSRAPDFERINGRIVGRAPVSLAWARSRRPVLVALLAGLKGVYLEETENSPANPDANNSYPPRDTAAMAHVVSLVNLWRVNDPCHARAERIQACTSPLATWQQWNEFCGALDLLKANFNPNSDLNKFGPNRSMWRQVDKSDLQVYSTEFSLLTPQAHTLESVGRVLGRDGRLLAQRVLKAGVRPLPAFRLSTQQEFVCEDLGNLEVFGDEREPRLPGFSIGGNPAFVSQSRGLGMTWGHRLDTRRLQPDSRYLAGWMNGASQGAAIQSYPEPCYDATPNQDEAYPDPTATGLSIAPAGYDGNLQLATVEVPDDPAWNYGVPALLPDLKLLAGFDDGFDLDAGDAYPGNPSGKQNQPDAYQATRGNGSSPDLSELRFSLLHRTTPNTLYPDGCYSEKDRAPAYFDRGNADGFHGVLSFWVKPNHAYTARRKHQYVHRTNYTARISSTASTDQLFWVGDASDNAGQNVAGCFEIGHQNFDAARVSLVLVEHEFRTPGRPQVPRRWRLVTFSWDARALSGGDPRNIQSGDDCGEILLDAGSLPGDIGAVDLYTPGVAHRGNWPQLASDLTEDERIAGLSVPHLLCLGRHGRFWEHVVDRECGSGADATLDEFALYDFGGAGPDGIPAALPDTLASPAWLARERFKEGRYYAESSYYPPGIHGDGEAASWVSAPILLPRGAGIGKIAWTWNRPVELPTDYAEVELLDVQASGYLDAATRSRSTLGPDWSRDRQEWTPGLPASGPFRLRVVFRRDVALPEGTPILDSPMLDDLTVSCTLQGGPHLGAFGEGS